MVPIKHLAYDIAKMKKKLIIGPHTIIQDQQSAHLKIPHLIF